MQQRYYGSYLIVSQSRLGLLGAISESPALRFKLSCKGSHLGSAYWVPDILKEELGKLAVYFECSNPCSNVFPDLRFEVLFC